jgi:predicted RNA binding protein YcfA (HicA-like mRNA interferase family)
MGNFRPLPIKCWEKFLAQNGFTYCGRTKGSHDLWTKRGKRTIPVWGDEKEIPALHLKTGCRTIGIDLSTLYEWARINC